MALTLAELPKGSRISDYISLGIATSAGYDCDNQAATTGGFIGVLKGWSGIGDVPTQITLNLPSQGKWKKPFNNLYVNTTRDGLPLRTPINEIVSRIASIAKLAILENGGRMEMRDGKPAYIINSDF